MSTQNTLDKFQHYKQNIFCWDSFIPFFELEIKSVTYIRIQITKIAWNSEADAKYIFHKIDELFYLLYIPKNCKLTTSKTQQFEIDKSTSDDSFKVALIVFPF